MNFYQIKEQRNEVYPAILLEQILSQKTRKVIRATLFYLMSITFILFILTLFAPQTGISEFYVVSETTIFFSRSIFILIFCVWFTLYLLELMYLSFYFKKTKVDFEVLKLVYKSNPADLTKTFMESTLGEYALLRLGITRNVVKDFLKNRTDFVTEAEYEIIENDDEEVSFSEFAFSLIHFDTDFSQLLKSNGVTPKDFKDALDWISRSDQRIRQEQRWWSKENLAKIPSIGTSFAYGQTYYLDDFGYSIFNEPTYIHLGDKWRIYQENVELIENILLKQRGANVILTARETEAAMEVISSFGKKIALGITLPSLEDKSIYVLDFNLLFATYEDKTQFENILQKILGQASYAGNIILVIPQLSDFVESAHQLGTDVKDLLSEALNSTKLQVIATSTNRGFHETLETDLNLMRSFEKISLPDLDEDSAIKFIEDEAQIIESKEKIIFTYQALKQVVKSADRYFSEGSVSDKAVDILEEVANYAVSKKKILIGENDVAEIIEAKTGVPLGVLTESEKRKLSDIEMLLKKKVIGQDRAIESISEAMKRARLGVANPNRPLGSFLFIGPTGVGKTETSKALTQIFFEDEENLLRIDMTEFNDDQAVQRLIGEGKTPGVLASKIRENKYGVLLLDEFEKAHPDVHNLFLQILDEGFFSDGMGEKVNARNLIIIATSNAGSDLMYRAIDKNINFQSIKEQTIGYLIDNRLFRPEFLNRFDDVILFNPLKEDVLEIIAGLMIDKLNKRLQDKGLDVRKDQDLLKYLVSKGTNQKFGAREINRVIQKEIETKIAEALISGQIQKGDTISFILQGDELEVNSIN